MFDLKSPCANCPFKKGMGSTFRLNKRRLAGIFDALAFQCHKTVLYGETEEGHETSAPGDKPQQCAGLMAILAREGRPNTIMQVAIRYGELDTSKLDPRREAYDTSKQAVRAHLEGEGPKGKFRQRPRLRPLPDHD